MPLKRHGPPSKQPDRDKTKPTTKTLPGLPPRKPKIIGLFSLSGTGTSFLLEELREEMKEDGFAFNDGSEALTAICPGGLMAYNALGAVKRARYRDVTITAFENECVRKDVIGVVVRYLAFWNEESECFSVAPVADLKAHTHILYLELPFAHFPQYWGDIHEAEEADATFKHWDCWQKSEICYLRRFCRKKDITFTVLTPHLGTVHEVSSLLRDFRVLTDWDNRRYAEEQLIQIMGTPCAKSVETVLLFDADGTLSPQDSEHLLWCRVPCPSMPLGLLYTPSKETLCQLSSTYKDYLQMVLLHEEVFDEKAFAAACEDIAGDIRLYPDMLALLRRAVETPHTLPIILTGGPRLVWENVLKRVGMFETVYVIGGGRHEDRAIMTPEVKGWLVTVLQEKCYADVWAFGSGQVDAIMLMKADQAVFIIDSETWLTQNISPAWKDSLRRTCPQLHEVILSTNGPLVLQYKPQDMRLLGKKLVAKIFARRLRIFYVSLDKPSEIMMSFEPEGSPAYPLWKSTHREIGSFLAARYLKEIITNQKVRSNGDFLFSTNISILAATPCNMPMAFGIQSEFVGSQLLPPDTLKEPGKHSRRILMTTRVLFLVKSVIIDETFLMDLMEKHSMLIESLMRVVIVAGVIYSPVLTKTKLARLVGQKSNISFVTLHFADDLDYPNDAPVLDCA